MSLVTASSRNQNRRRATASMDALAAAYAEAGDFAAALRASKIEARRRLGLYKQKQPHRQE